MNFEDIKACIKDKAETLGFDALACTSLDPFDSEKFRSWLELGFADRMTFLEKNLEKRLNPALLLEGAKTAVVVCANFFRNSVEERIALYAQGLDYHEVIKNKLKELSAILETFGGRQKICVDTAPIAEKLLAARAGLGAIGKNTLLIRKNNGAWSFLGVMLTTLELPLDFADKASLPHCGACRKCIDACPTGALTQDMGLDARKCISNLSIERKRDSLSDAEKRLLGAQLFGCDKCLSACPFGKNANSAIMPEFSTTITLPPDATWESLQSVSKSTPIERCLR